MRTAEKYDGTSTPFSQHVGAGIEATYAGEDLKFQVDNDKFLQIFKIVFPEFNDIDLNSESFCHCW